MKVKRPLCIVSLVVTHRPDIEWSKENGSMPRERYTVDSNGKLELTNVTASDSGYYVCKARNDLGGKQTTAIIEVNFSPRLKKINVKVYKKIGTDVVMPCPVTGYPKPNVTWSKSVGSLQPNCTVVKDGHLTLLMLRKEDSGTYRCKAENRFGSVTTETILIVVELPRFTVTPPSSFASDPGKTIRLNCSAEGDPRPIITWTKENGVLPEGRHEVKNDSLILKKLNSTDFGVYVCTATSAVVSVRSTVAWLKADCLEIYNWGERRDGVYMVQPDSQGLFQVYCDMTTDGGGWTVFQRRKDGSVDFYLNWQQYKTGFGNLSGEFWLGNDYIHRLTARTASSLRVEIGDWDGARRYAKYGSFNVGDESDKYRLSVGGYSGTAGDALAYHNNWAFTTKDRDNDGVRGGNCAVQRTGAWWYYSCTASNLNGKYLGNVVKFGGLEWFFYKNNEQSFKTTEMKLRPQKP